MPLADRTIELTPRHLQDVPSRKEVRLAAGEILFRQGDMSDLVYVVEEGNVELVRALASGGEEILARYGRGDYFGELGPMFRLRRSATARAMGPCRLVGLPVSDFRRSLQRRSVGDGR